jgi:pimeloyl-ACP methyl ester carboxylesterase
MKIHSTSFFKDPIQDKAFLKDWVKRLEAFNNRKYEQFSISTSLGNTQIYTLNSEEKNLPALVVFPGYRTSSLFWDLDRNLDNLSTQLRIFLVEINGQPNLSDGNTPDIKSTGYGEWASQVFEILKLESAYVAGASFGALVCMKLCQVSPLKVKAAFLLNPGCFRFISLSLENLYYNLLPVLSTNTNNIQKFLDKVVFHKPSHTVSESSYQLLNEFLLMAISRFRDKNQKPYNMSDECPKIETDTYLLVGKNDIFFPPEKSIQNAKKILNKLKGVFTFNGVGHGIETYPDAMCKIGEIIEELEKGNK